MKRIPIIKMICVVLSLWMLAVLALTSCADAPTEEIILPSPVSREARERRRKRRRSLIRRRKRCACPWITFPRKSTRV